MGPKCSALEGKVSIIFLLIDYGIVERASRRKPYFCRSGKETAWKRPGKRFQDTVSRTKSLFLPLALL